MICTVDFHHVTVCPPYSKTASGARMITPPDDAFNPSAIRVTRASEVRAGDIVIGTAQHHYDHLLNPLDRSQWVSYFSHACTPQTSNARSFDPAHCDWCTHNAEIRAADTSCWTVDGCTPYRPDALLLVVPRELA